MKQAKTLARCAAALWMVTVVAMSPAADYPQRAVRMVVPTSSGAGADTLARLLAPPLSERLGQSVVVDNRAGAGTIIGTDLVAKAPADGHTLLMGVGTLATAPALVRNVPYDVLRDFAPVIQLASLPFVLVVHPSVPARTLKELIALARARPGELSYASSGSATNPHLSMELFLIMTGTRMLHVPYKGTTPGMLDVLAGRVAAMPLTVLPALPQLRAGRLRALGVTSARRISAAPELPTFAEAGVAGYESAQWYGVLAPAHTPVDIVQRLQRELAALLALPEIRARLLAEGAEPVAGSSQAFAEYIRAELAKWQRVVKSAGITPE